MTSIHRRPWGIALLLTLLAASLLAACNSSDSDDNESAALRVQTQQGPVQGKDEATLHAYRGIPYAAPPVGDLRWRVPQPPAQRENVLDASSFANHCPQPSGPFGLPSETEDCLYLNVYTPDEAGDHPVMVWIHGGALAVGESDDYDPTPLVKQGVVVVTMNYRLGILGFLAHPALSGESDAQASGDYGIMDQIAALQWVQNNIAHFGGDADNVTIFGESAGARSVLYLMASSEAEGLFHKAIIESGSGFDSLSQPTLAEKEAQGRQFATSKGCDGQTAACLRDLSVGEILNEQGQSVSPNLRPDLLPQQIGTALRNGSFSKVPVLLGTNRNEWRIFVGLTELATGQNVTQQNYVPSIAATLRVSLKRAQTVADEYPPGEYDSPSLALGQLGTDGNFSCKGHTLAGILAPQVTTYAYEFRDFNAPQRFIPSAGFPYGAYHASEIQYLFGIQTPIEGSLDADQKTLADKMVRYWTQFAGAGDPNVDDGTQAFWPQYNADSDTYLSLVPPMPQTTTTIAADHNCDFWTDFRMPASAN